MKTDLTKIMSVTGYPGLFKFLSQNKGGVVVESLLDKKRTWMGPSAKISTLSDIYIFTQEGEMKLQEVFEKIKAHLDGAQAPIAKSDSQVLKDFFKQVVPDYDSDRFYTSHMKKVLEWYHILADNQALDFMSEEEIKAQNEEKAE